MLTVAGSDSGGGAGIQADLKTMLAHGVHGMSVLAAVTAQNSVGVQGYWELPAEAVLELGPRAVLVKGGHLAGDAVDLLLTADGVQRTYRSARLDNRHTHGTGCTLASAVASRLALGDALPDAVAAAKDYVTGAIAAGFPLGAGIGPVDHAWRWR